MPVDQASYRAYEGVRRPGKRVAFAIAGTMIRKMRRRAIVRAFVFSVPILICLVSLAVMVIFYMNEELFKRFDVAGVNILIVVNRSVQDGLGLFPLLLAALVGAPLIAEDRRAKALPLYFSRPITHVDYVLGKFLTLFFFLGIALLGPPILMYLADIAFNPSENAWISQLPVLGHSLVPSLARMVSLSAVVLGASALTRRTNHAALLLFGILIPIDGIAFIFAREVFDDPAWLAMSPRHCISRITMEHLSQSLRGIDGRRAASAIMPLSSAWIGLSVWTAAGLGVLFARIRRVEVVA